MNTISRFPIARLFLSEAHFCAWLGQAQPGEHTEYHRGFLAIDTVRASSNLIENDRKELVRVGRRAWWAAEKNLVHLVQRRLGPDRFSYLAIARQHPKQLQEKLLTLLAQDPESGALANPDMSFRRRSSF